MLSRVHWQRESRMSAVMRVPGVAEVRSITAMPDPVLRNLRITQCYHELAAAFAARTPGANWCVYATWASKQAGRTIRQEDLRRALDSELDANPHVAAAVEAVTDAVQALGPPQPRDVIRKKVRDVLGPAAPMARAGAAVARGNLKVFAEIGLEFARFLEGCAQDARPDPSRIAAFCDSLRGGEAPEGQQLLRQAFTRYYAALFEPDAATAAELLFFANLEVGLHEQIRLQPDIAEALDAAVPAPQEITAQLLRVHFRLRGWVARIRLILRRLLGRPTHLERAVEALASETRAAARAVITEHLMTLTIPPDVRLRLGRDLHAPTPAILGRLANRELLALLARIDPDPDSLAGTGAEDWGSLDDRMHFISALFRCYHAAPELFTAPFTADQLRDLLGGRLPGGEL
jgi:hypothetical protein